MVSTKLQIWAAELRRFLILDEIGELLGFRSAKPIWRPSWATRWPPPAFPNPAVRLDAAPAAASHWRTHKKLLAIQPTITEPLSEDFGWKIEDAGDNAAA